MASRSDRSILGKEPSIEVDFRVVPTSDQGNDEMRKYLGLLENKTELFYHSQYIGSSLVFISVQ
jgi:hypothetical protein